MFCLPQVGALPLFLPYPCDFRTICATGTAVGWRCPACCPQTQTGSPTQTSSTVTTSASLPPPPPGFPPLPPGFYQPRPPRSPPGYPCSMCSHEVGKDSLTCSTCSKWVHFSCSSLTRANFANSARLAPPWVGIALLVSIGTLILPPTSKRPTASSLQLCPHPHSPTNMFRSNEFISTSPLTSSPP